MALNLIKKDESRSVVSIKLDEQEFHNIFKEYYAALCSFAFQYMEDADMSADIVQDVFAKLWQIRDDFFYLHQVKAFLYTAVRNHALNELEHSKVAHEYEQKIIAKKADAFFRDAIVEEETFRILSEAIEKLPTQMRAIMQLALEGKKNAEIAERLNVSPETVHTLKKVAYKKLRAFLTDYYYCLLLFIYKHILFYFFKKKSLSIHHVFILACIIIKDRLKHAKL